MGSDEVSDDERRDLPLPQSVQDLDDVQLRELLDRLQVPADFPLELARRLLR